MDKITKFLKKLDATEREIVRNIIEKILAGDTSELDIKKLKGFDDIYRARMGDIRIIYHHKGSAPRLIEISRRSEKTYRKF